MSEDIAKHPGHAPIAEKVFSETAYEKPLSRYENTNISRGACLECFAIFATREALLAQQNNEINS